MVDGEYPSGSNVDTERACPIMNNTWLITPIARNRNSWEILCSDLGAVHTYVSKEEDERLDVEAGK